MYLITQSLFLKFFGLNCLFAFYSLKKQVNGLYGTTGVQPFNLVISSLIKNNFDNKFWKVPTLFWLSQSNLFINLVLNIGLISSSLIFLGNLNPIYFAITYICYQSFVSIGSPFLSFQWDVMLLEMCFYSFFYSMTSPPNLFLHYALWLFFVRFMMSACIAKLKSGDKNWWNLTATTYHYLTQPLPTLPAWYAHKLPINLHKLSCAITLLIQTCCTPLLLTPFFFRKWLILPQILLQFLIALTGNYCFFNTMTLNMLILFYPDSSLSFLQSFANFRIPLNINSFLLFISLFVVYNNISIFIQQFFSHNVKSDKLNEIINYKNNYAQFNIINTYGLFANMTTQRNEIVIEGSMDGKNWKEYHFKFKPGKLETGLKLIAPMQPRLDWQMWFAALNNFKSNPWFLNFLIRLVKNEKEVLKLIDHNPFANQKSVKFIRALLYSYTFTSIDEHKNTKNYWNRKLIGEYSPVIEVT